MFTIVEGPVRTFWVPSDGTSTYYMGQILSYVAASKANTPGTVVPLAVPSGAADTTNLQIPAGVVVGFNRRTPRSVTVGTISREYDTGVVLMADEIAREYTGAEGMYSKGDPQVLIQIAEILPNTVLRGPVYNAAYGTAMGSVTSLVASATGFTTAGTGAWAAPEWGATAIANAHTLYCRTGANMGLYRTTNNTDSTAPDVTVAFPYAVAIGDTFVYAPFKQGHTGVYIGGPGLYIDSAKVPTLIGTTLFSVIVYKMDLSVSGREYVDFRFGADHFCAFRA